MLEEHLSERLTKRGAFWVDEDEPDGDRATDVVWDRLAREDAVYFAVRAPSEAVEEAKSKDAIRTLCARLKHGSVLDLGCGYGRIAKYLLPVTNRVEAYVGLDRSEVMLSLFFERYLARPEENKCPLTLIKSDIGDIPLDSGSLDNIVTAGVYLHNNKEAIVRSISEVHRVLKRGGRFFALSSFPNRFSLNGVQGACCLGLLRCVGKDKTNGPIRYFSRREIEHLLREFSTVEIQEHGFTFLPKSVLFLPGVLDRAYRAAVFEPSQALLRRLLSKERQKRLCAHFDVIAQKK